MSATWLEIAREELPGVPADYVEYVMWEHTGYPCFFDGDPETTFRAQLREWAKLSSRLKDTP